MEFVILLLQPIDKIQIQPLVSSGIKVYQSEDKYPIHAASLSPPLIACILIHLWTLLLHIPVPLTRFLHALTPVSKDHPETTRQEMFKVNRVKCQSGSVKKRVTLNKGKLVRQDPGLLIPEPGATV